MGDSYAEKAEALKKIIDKSRYLVCLLGVEIGSKCGCINYRDVADSYDMEAKYGYSPDEMFNVTFFNTRVEQFYKFYKNDMLQNLGTVGEGLRALARMERQGKLKSVITRDIYSLPTRAGCEKVYELHGSVYRNFCPHCGREYPVEYIQKSHGVPKCESCGVVIRPGVSMVGEIVDNALISRAADEVKKADTLIFLDCALKSSLADTFLRYFEGDELVLIKSKKHYADMAANLVIYANPMDVLAQLGY